jgi:tetratricopeptide (TPR) repeat protein
MTRVDRRLIFGVATLLMIFSAMNSSAAVAPAEGACDVAADIALEVGDYATAIELHQRVLRSESNNANARYHLGFAYGMAGLTTEEIGEYRTAIALGLKKWDLFLNLGLAYADRHDPERAIAALETAISLGPEHAESHFNLAVVYEEQNRLDEALQQIITSLVLDPRNSDALNTDAIICARMGNVSLARTIWMQLLRQEPNYGPARTNLALMNQWSGDTSEPDIHLRPQWTISIQTRSGDEE